jgi:multiple sugar transport system substrate-binding protein
MQAFWKEACDEGGLAWDDTNNNRAFHAGEISATLNGASIYLASG